MPLPVFVTVKVCVVVVGEVVVVVVGGVVVVGEVVPPPVKFAAHVFAASMTTLNGLVVPLQLPLQLVNVAPVAGVAVSLTVAPVV